MIRLNYLKSWKKLSFLIAGIGVLLYIILTLVAMSFYPDNFSLTEHYYSDLGTTITINNSLPNSISCIIFIIACFITGLSLMPFWIVLLTLLTDTKIKKILAFLGTISGIIGAFFLIALSIFPYDIFLFEHGLTSRGFYLFLTIAILLYTIGLFFNKSYNKIFTLLCLAFSIFSILFVFKIYPEFILFNTKKIYIYPSLQKVIFNGFWLWIIFHIVKLWKSI